MKLFPKTIYATLFLLMLSVYPQSKIEGEWYLAAQVNEYRNGTAESTGSDAAAFFRRNNKLPDYLYISPKNRFVLIFRDTLFTEVNAFSGEAVITGNNITMTFDDPIGNPSGKLLEGSTMMLVKEFEDKDVPYKKITKVYHKADIREDFAAIFNEYGLTGTIIIYDEAGARFTMFNPERTRESFLPASTFKVFNSLAGLETGAVKDETEILPWDGKPKGRKEIEKDMDMREAIKVSSVWFYQEIARRVGDFRMRDFMRKNVYGNMSTGGGIDRFWLDGDLRISPEQQIDFLRRMYHYKLSFKRENVDKVKSIMLLSETDNYKLYGKTGWAQPGGKDIGWFIGFVETGGNVYYFAVNVESPLRTNSDFMIARRAIAEKALTKMGVLK